MALFRQPVRRARGLRALFATASPADARPSGRTVDLLGVRRHAPGGSGAVPDGSVFRTKSRLSELKPGETGVVSRLLGTAQGRLRLMEMGLTPGAHVKVMHAAAFGGPLQITVRGYQLSLRRAEAAAIVLGEL